MTDFAPALPEAAARAWTETLGVDRVGPQDNFFALGGDSLLAIHAAALLSRDGYEASAATLFTTATFAEFVAALHAGSPPAAAAVAVDDTALLPDQAWYLHVGRRGISDPALPADVSVLDVDGRLDAEVVGRAVGHLWATHPSLRAYLPDDGPVPRWAYLPPDAPPYEVALPPPDADLRSYPHVVIADLARRIDPAAGPLVRWAFVPAPAGSHRLVFVGHFAVVDEYSLRVLTDDLDAVLTALLDGRPPTLPATPAAGEWAVRLREYVRGLPEPAAELIAALTDEQVARVVPDSTEPNTEGLARYAGLDLGRQALTALTGYGRSVGCTLQDVLAAVVLRAFFAWSGRTRLSFKSVTAGRNLLPPDRQPDLSRVVGRLAMSSLHLVTAPGDAPGAVAELAAQVRDTRQPGAQVILKAWLDESSALYRRLDRDPDLLFNFLGRSLASPARLVRPTRPGPHEWYGVPGPEDDPRFVKFYVVIADTEDALSIAVGYPGAQFSESRIGVLLDLMRAQLTALGAR